MRQRLRLVRRVRRQLRLRQHGLSEVRRNERADALQRQVRQVGEAFAHPHVFVEDHVRRVGVEQTAAIAGNLSKDTQDIPALD